MIGDERLDVAASRVASAVGEPARARMLFALVDGHARTSTELAVLAEVSPSTASVHLRRLLDARLISVVAQGKHRYHALAGPRVAAMLENLRVVAGVPHARFVPATPRRLRAARTCYDHMAGGAAVALHDRLLAAGWLAPLAGNDAGYDLSATGVKTLDGLGVDVAAARSLRRRFAYGCLDWSERRPHLGGSLAAALLACLVRKRWVSRHDDSRALSLTASGRRELRARLGLMLE